MEPARQTEPRRLQQREKTRDKAKHENRQKYLREEELQTLLAVQQAITSRLDLERVLQMIADEARRLTGADMGAVYLLADACLEIAVVSGDVDPALLGFQLPLDCSAAGAAVRTRQAQVVADTAVAHSTGAVTDAGEIAYTALIEKTGARSFVVVPLLSSCGPLGTITVASRSPGGLGEDACRLLQLLAPGAVIALENARLYAQAQQAAALKERQRLYHDLHDAVTQTLFSANLIAEVLPKLWEMNPAEGQVRLEELCQLTRGALNEMRGLLDAPCSEAHDNPG